MLNIICIHQPDLPYSSRDSRPVLDLVSLFKFSVIRGKEDGGVALAKRDAACTSKELASLEGGV